MEQLEDNELMAMAEQGRSEGLGLLFERHHRPLFQFLYRLTGERGLSEDLLQEAFLRALKYARSFKVDGAFRPWIYQIARRAHLDHCQRLRPEVGLKDWDEVPGSDARSPLNCVEARQDSDRLTRALWSIAPAQRELLLLAKDSELSYRDMAEILGCSEGALKVRVHRALKELRQAFQSLPGGGA